MHQVHNHRQPHRMRLAHQGFQFFRSAEARRRGEKIADMVSETAVIGVFGDRHQLNRVVARFFDMRQDRFDKFAVCADSFLFLGHPDMALVNQQTAYGGDIERIAAPVERLGGSP